MLTLTAIWRTVRGHPLVFAGAALAILSVTLGVWAGRRWAPQPTITTLPGATKVVEVPVDHLVTKTVTQYVSDKTEAARLMAENEALKVRVASLTESLATHQSQGNGPVVTVPTATVPAAERPPATTAPTVTRFSDWRLTFTADAQAATYTLRQRFEVLATAGRDTRGAPVNLVKLFEVGPGETRTPIPDVRTTVVLADETRPHWYARLHVQAGVVVAWDAKGAQAVGALIGPQWLKRGRTQAPGDTTFALFTPVLYVAQTTREMGLLPVSVNLGRLPRQPFTNLWLSPYFGVAVGTRSLTRAGVALTATF